MRVLVYDSSAELAAEAAAFIATALSQWDGPVTFGLAGGGTPKATYARLAETDVDWGRVTAWLPDERWVAADHEESNARMARESFVGTTGASLLFPDYEIGDPETAAAVYELGLRATFVERSGVPAPDLVLLGVGDDGHTASLFPGTLALGERERSYVANWVDAKDTWRLTATYPLLWSARRVAFLVAGSAKAQVVSEIIDGDADYPAGVVARGAADVTWLLDAPAASRLRNRSP